LFNVIRACFGFLQTEDVGILLGEVIEKFFRSTARRPLTFQEISFTLPFYATFDERAISGDEH